jgi:uncharacterized membrane-anchored protein
MNQSTNRTTYVAIAVALQLLLVPLAVFGQLSARLTGDEHLLRVGPVDPIDPFRGAYVTLGYPDLQPDDRQRKQLDEAESNDVYVTLAEQDGVLVAEKFSTSRPADGVYLACDDSSWQLRCGIESLFLPQDKAADVQKDIDQSGLFGEEFDQFGNPLPDRRDSGYAAKVKIDRWGHATVVELVKR